MMIRAEWPGMVMDVFCQVGQEVEEDEALILMEGTDSAHTPYYINAPDTGKIRKIFVEEGDYVDEDDDMVEMLDAD